MVSHGAILQKHRSHGGTMASQPGQVQVPSLIVKNSVGFWVEHRAILCRGILYTEGQLSCARSILINISSIKWLYYQFGFLTFDSTTLHMAGLLWLTALLFAITVNKTVNMPPLTYCSEELLQLRPVGRPTRLSSDVYKTIRELGICSVKPTRRGHRSFVKRQQYIPTLITTNKRNYSTDSSNHGANLANLRTLAKHTSDLNHLNICLWNVQSLRNKSVIFSDYVTEHNIDIMIVTESWLKADEHVIIGECTPPGYIFLNIPRPSGTGWGGIAIVFKTQLNLRIRYNYLQTTCFESVCLSDKLCRLNLVVLYRPPPSTGNNFRTSDFLSEFDNFLDEISLLPGKLLVAGDMNIHWDRQEKSEVRQYASIISSVNLVQHINVPTHRSGHILDHVLACQDSDLFIDYDVRENPITWHHCVHFKLNMKKPASQRITVTSRNYKNIDAEKFSAALHEHLHSVPNDLSEIDPLLKWYNTVSIEVLDRFAPAKTRSRSIRHHQPWYNDDVHVSRRARRRAERQWRKSRSEDDHERYLVAIRAVNDCIINAKKSYYTSKLDGANNKTVFQVINSLLNNQNKLLPAFDDPRDLATRFSRFFTTKVSDIRKNLDDSDKQNMSLFTDSRPLDCEQFSNFVELSHDDVVKCIGQMSNASCMLDAHPTWLLKEHIKEHMPVLTRIVNESLGSGTFPTIAHRAIVTPLLKKSSLEKEVLKNYRPVSNLSFVAKLIEKCAANQFVNHLNANGLIDPLQSAYRSSHSTETALIKVMSDIISDIDSRHVVLIVLLDMSAAFDTVDHKILLHRLRISYAVSGTAYHWFEHQRLGITSEHI